MAGKAVRGSREDGDLIDACGPRPFEAAFVRNESRLGDTRDAVDGAEDLIGIRKLRDGRG